MTLERGGESDEFVRTNLVGESRTWRAVVRLVRQVAPHDVTTLIEGETGTGKDLVARAIHYLGRRREFPFIPINCGALPDTLLESELFGHERGAFTDARERRTGLVAEAHGGTLFLDEIEAMSPRAQVVLLRFLQDQSYLPLGARTVAKADVRIIAASNADLDEEVARGRFRSDLWFRLRVLHLDLPPLRRRSGDIGLLAQLFLDRCARQHRRGPYRLSAHALAVLEAHDWPGNVRELESVITREFLLHELDGDELDVHMQRRRDAEEAGDDAPQEFKRAKAIAMAQFERNYVRQLLMRAKGNLSLAARMSRKDRSALNKLVKKHGFTPRLFRAS
jgi:DNA-binding NtrC family response regulator